jgi:hypothetical protein
LSIFSFYTTKNRNIGKLSRSQYYYLVVEQDLSAFSAPAYSKMCTHSSGVEDPINDMKGQHPLPVWAINN